MKSCKFSRARVHCNLIYSPLTGAIDVKRKIFMNIQMVFVNFIGTDQVKSKFYSGELL